MRRGKAPAHKTVAKAKAKIQAKAKVEAKIEAKDGSKQVGHKRGKLVARHVKPARKVSKPAGSAPHSVKQDGGAATE